MPQRLQWLISEAPTREVSGSYCRTALALFLSCQRVLRTIIQEVYLLLNCDRFLDDDDNGDKVQSVFVSETHLVSTFNCFMVLSFN